jgi:hypothetical protein
MSEAIKTPRGLLHQIVAEVATEQNLDRAKIEDRYCRQKPVVAARAAVCARLFSHGITADQIGRMLQQPRATVLKLIQKQLETDHAREDGTEGSADASAAGGEGSGEQAPDGRREDQAEGEGDWQAEQDQSFQDRRSRAMRARRLRR